MYVDTVGAEYIRMSASDSGLYTAYDEFRMTFTLVTLVKNSATRKHIFILYYRLVIK